MDFDPFEMAKIHVKWHNWKKSHRTFPALVLTAILYLHTIRMRFKDKLVHIFFIMDKYLSLAHS